MTIEHGTERDITQIVGLLKISLGEELMPKSEEFWRWKHINNPFGPSPVLISKEGNEIVGVRAFMRWCWRLGDQKISSVRAVDTATHPGHQGKGIFKKLTLSLVEECQLKGDRFVFNTPNDKSGPGYLKMGWETAGRLPIIASVRRPLSIAFNLVNRKTGTDKKFANATSTVFNHPGLAKLLADCGGQAISTDIDVSYLKWRYEDVPVATYQACCVEQGSIMCAMAVGRLKHSRIGLELRIVELFVSDERHVKAIRREILELAGRHGADLITLSGTLSGKMSSCLPFGIKVNKGPIVTIRPLADKNLSQLRGFSSWSPSLGDLELF